jgi:hypothetical protein
MIKYPVTEGYGDRNSESFLVDADGVPLAEFVNARDCLETVRKLNAKPSPVLLLVRYKGREGIYPVIQEIGNEYCILTDFPYENEPRVRALRVWRCKALFEVIGNDY